MKRDWFTYLNNESVFGGSRSGGFDLNEVVGWEISGDNVVNEKVALVHVGPRTHVLKGSAATTFEKAIQAKIQSGNTPSWCGQQNPNVDTRMLCDKNLGHPGQHMYVDKNGGSPYLWD